MADKFEGFVVKISHKDGVNKQGNKWFKYGFVLGVDGTESGWIGMPFNVKFPFAEKDYISVEAEKDDKGYLVAVKGTGRKIDPPKGKSAEAAADPVKSGAQKDPEVQKRIQYQNARSAALELVALLVAKDALPLTATKSKAGEATRYDEIVAFVDKETVRFHNDVTTLRLLETVGDSGTVTAGNDTPIDNSDLNEGADPDDDITF